MKSDELNKHLKEIEAAVEGKGSYDHDGKVIVDGMIGLLKEKTPDMDQQMQEILNQTEHTMAKWKDIFEVVKNGKDKASVDSCNVDSYITMGFFNNIVNLCQETGDESLIWASQFIWRSMYALGIYCAHPKQRGCLHSLYKEIFTCHPVSKSVFEESKVTYMSFYNTGECKACGCKLPCSSDCTCDKFCTCCKCTPATKCKCNCDPQHCTCGKPCPCSDDCQCKKNCESCKKK